MSVMKTRKHLSSGERSSGRRKCEEVLALIPARGGSKSIPRKNLVPLLGKPLIGWAIEVALAAQLVSRVIVSTDDEEIAGVALEYGAEVPFMRPAEISGDLALDVEFHRHALVWLSEKENYEPKLVVNLRPTSPSRRPETIDDAIEEFLRHPEADSLRSVHLASETPYKMWLRDGRGYLKPIVTLADVREPYNQPRQSLPLVYWQDGYVDITKPEVILEKNSTTGDVVIPFIIENPAVDIDYPEAMAQAERQLKGHENSVGSTSRGKSHTRHPS